MTEVRLRNVDPSLVEAIRDMARRKSLSLDAFVKEQLDEIVSRDKIALLAELKLMRQEQRERHGGELPDSTPGIREERNARW